MSLGESEKPTEHAALQAERELLRATTRFQAVTEAVAKAALLFLRASDPADEIPAILQQLGEAVGVSRSYVYENSLVDGDLCDTLRFEWTSPGSRSPLANAVNVDHPYSPDYDRYVRVLGTGGYIAELTRDAPGAERAALEADGVKSFALVPIFVGDGWWGYMGFDDCEHERVWTSEEINALATASEALGAALERQQLDARLREEEARFRTLVEESDAVTYIDEREGRSTTRYVSPQVEGMLGYKVEEWLADPELWEKLLHPEDRERELSRNDASAEAGHYSSVYRMIARDGRTVWVRDEAHPVLDNDGNTMYWLGVTMDVTSERETEARLREIELRQRTLIDQLPAIFYIDEIGSDRTLFISPQIEQILGYTPEEWMADDGLFYERLHPDDYQRVAVEDPEKLASGVDLVDEYRLFARDGHMVWLRDMTTDVRSDEGQPLWEQGILLDITEQKEAEEALRRAAEQYREMVEQLPGVVYLEDPTGVVASYISPKIEELAGVTPEEWIGDPDIWGSMIHPDDRERVLAADRRVNQTGELFSAEYRLLTRDGRTVWVHDTSVQISGLGGTASHWFGLITDITERRSAQELEQALAVEQKAGAKLRELDEIKNQFLAGVSHDLRTPTSAILGLALTLDQGTADLDEEQRRDFIHRIATNARRLQGLVTDLLDVYRLDQGVLAAVRSEVDLGALVAGLVDQADYLDGHPCEVDVQSIRISVDPGKVSRIVENLLVNASKHTPDGTPIRVRVSRQDDGALITVEDSGPGIPEDEKDTVFEEFAVGATSRNEGSPGLGVGLSLVSRLAELHGGRVWLEDREGGGASFKVYLPAENST